MHSGDIQTDGRYEILGELGRGGMGVVYRARDRESGREVALKVLLTELDEKRLKRFHREGELTARLQHPSIVRIFSSGVLQGRPYLAYELVDGQALGDALPTVDLRTRVELIRDAARGLGFAHAQGVLHRDVKPDNILVGSDGRARVADFGLATARDVERLTRTGAALGTPTHMSPEQIGGEVKDLGPTTDTWSLGVILYQALTGRLPFEWADNMVELAGKIITGTFVAPRRHDASIPEDLARICFKALARAPAARYLDGDAMAEDLDRYLRGERVAPAAPQTTGAIAGFGVGLGAALLLLMVALWAAGDSASPPGDDARVKTPVSETLSASQVAAGRRTLDEALETAKPPARHAALSHWLTENAKHPAASEAKAARADTQRLFPVATFTHNRRPEPAHACFVGNRDLLTYWNRTAIRYWNLDAPGAPVWELRLSMMRLSEIAVAPDRKRAVLATMRGLHILDLETRTVSPLEQLKARNVSIVCFSADGRRLAFASQLPGVGVRVVSWPDLKPLLTIDRDFTRSVALSSDGRLLGIGGGGYKDVTFKVSSTQGDFLEVWYVDGAGPIVQQSRRAPPRIVCFSPDDRYLIVGDTVGSLFGVDVENPERQIEFIAKPDPNAPKSGIFFANRAHTGEVEGIAFSADRKTLFTSASMRSTEKTGQPELKAWSYPEGKELRQFLRPVSPIDLSQSPDKRLLAFGTQEGLAEVHVAER